ncbi:MAG: hypothetical protein HUU16_19420 [Candidatus Omnitrophica bacterium]|nr:hypothetical protein [Candidatus Omnitrophota bacterium]
MTQRRYLPLHTGPVSPPTAVSWPFWALLAALGCLGHAAWGQFDPDIQISPTDLTFALLSGQSSTLNLVVQNTAGGGPDLTYSLVTSLTDGGEVKIDTLGADVLSATGTNRYRGNMYQITKPARLRLAESYLNLPAGTQTLHFVVFESTAWNGTFTLIFEQTISRTGAGAAFYASDPMNLDLDVGKFYVVMMGWTGANFGYSYQEVGGGQSVSFGFRYGGFRYDGYPINSSITGSYSGSNAYYQRLTTDKTWLSVEADEGTLPAGASETIVVTANAAGLAGGTYIGSIVAASNDPDEATSNALVTLFVTPLPTSTPTRTATHTRTETPSPSSTVTNTPSITETPSVTVTATDSVTDTPTSTSTPTDTDTFTQTPSITETPTPTDSITPTPSETSTHTRTPTESSSPTRTETDTNTLTPTPTGTATETSTESESPTPTASPTATDSQTQEPPTFTATQTESPSRTATGTFTASSTLSETPTSTGTGAPTETSTLTPTLTEIPTITEIVSPSATETGLPTTTSTPIPTSSPTESPSVSPSPTPTDSLEPTATVTATVTTLGTPQLVEVVPDESLPIGLGTAIFEFVFSHRMDTTRDPVVTFGMLPPYNIGLSFIASPGWIDEFTWHGGVELTNLVADGLYTLGVSGARTEGGITIPRDTTHHFLFLKQSPNELTDGHVTDMATNALAMEWERSDRPDVSGHIIANAPQAQGPYEVADAAGPVENDFVHFGLNSDTPYFYRIYEVFLNKGNGTEVRQLTNTFDGRTLAKLANGRAEAISQTQMRITWESEDPLGTSGFQVRRADKREFLGDCGENPGTIVADIPPSERIAIDRNLRSDSVYYYDICILDSEGNTARLENTFAGRTLSMDSTLDGKVDTMDLLSILEAARTDENSLDVLIEFALNWETRME